MQHNAQTLHDAAETAASLHRQLIALSNGGLADGLAIAYAATLRKWLANKAQQHKLPERTIAQALHATLVSATMPFAD